VVRACCNSGTVISKLQESCSTRKEIAEGWLWRCGSLLLLLLLPVYLLCAGNYSKVHFLSLFIENAAPGDAISSLLSRPMSSAVSANVYAVYCDRWVAGGVRAPC
jgi:hypothetical protein